MRNIETYWPKEIANIKEFKEIARIENIYISKVNEKIEQFILGQFIKDAPLSAIKRYEKLLNITLDSSKTLEERRQIVLNRWNRRLPYTIKTLFDLVSSTVGKENVKINIQEYNLDLILLNQSTDLIREIKKTVEMMIPANIMFLMIAEYLNETFLQIKTDTTFTVNTNFYPRNNAEFLTLNKTWSLNGKYSINGYKSDKPVDFYPVGMQISTYIKNNVHIISNQTYCTDLKTIFNSKVSHKVKSDCDINTKQDTSIASHTFISNDIKIITKQAYKTDSKVNLAYSSENNIKADYKVKSERENIVFIRSSSKVTSNISSTVTIAKNIWKLDGAYSLDGSRIIPEKTENFIL